MDNRTIKDKIIKFVQNSPEDMNAKVAVFIAGMQAQKNMADCGGDRGNRLCMAEIDSFVVMKDEIGAVNK